jgi:hypothetical protein
MVNVHCIMYSGKVPSLLPQAKGGRKYQQLPPRAGQVHQGNQVRTGSRHTILYNILGNVLYYTYLTTVAIGVLNDL